MAASVCRKDSRPGPEICRPLAEMMPWVTVWSRPRGLPMATTHSPTRMASLSPSLAKGRCSGVDLDQGDVQLLVPAQHLGLVGPAVGDLHFDGGFAALDALDDVVVGEDLPVRGDEHARAARLDPLLVVLGPPGPGRWGPKNQLKKSSPNGESSSPRERLFTKLVLTMDTTVGFSFSATSAMGGRPPRPCRPPSPASPPGPRPPSGS